VVQVRQAVAADSAGIWQVRYAVTENTLTPGRISNIELLESIETTGRGWVVDNNGQIDGFAIGNAVTGNVWALFVRPECQGLGYGSALHKAMLDWFSTQSLDRLWLSTGTNTQARKFYEKNGWVCVGPYGSSEVKYEIILRTEYKCRQPF
jgi:GNAT superfamily N-acetyltransferase